MIEKVAFVHRLYEERVILLKVNKKVYLLSILSLIIGILLMEYLVRVYFVGVLIFFILIAFRTPTTKYDKTGESTEFSINLLRFIGLNAILYLVGGYVAAIFL